jgi:biopolymer transport protein ExbD
MFTFSARSQALWAGPRRLTAGVNRKLGWIGVAALEVYTMLLFSGLLMFLSATSCQVRADDRPKIANPKSNPTPTIAVDLHLSRDTKYGDAFKIIDKIRKQGATRWSLRAANAGEAPSAEVVADPGTPSDRIAAVVKELLDSGVSKISVEVKKVSKPPPLVIPDDSQAQSTVNSGDRCDATKKRKAIGLQRRR